MDWGHIYVETSGGERIADLHPAPGRSIFLWTPPERPLFVRQNDGRLEYAVLGSGPTQQVDLASARVPAVAARGATSLAFQNLFASPFVAADLERFAHSSRIELSSPRASESPKRTATWIAAGATALFGAGAITFGVLTNQQNERFHELQSSCSSDCERLLGEESEKGRTLQTLTNVSIGLTATSAAAALALFFIEPTWTEDSPPLSFGPGWIRVAGRL
jgi:hypothetical protein